MEALDTIALTIPWITKTMLSAKVLVASVALVVGKRVAWQGVTGLHRASQGKRDTLDWHLAAGVSVGR